MKKFAIYRQGKLQAGRRYDYATMPQPTRVKLVEAVDAEHAINAFIAQLPAGGGWDTSSTVVRLKWRGTVCDLWIRRFTPTGQYQGETYFYASEVQK